MAQYQMQARSSTDGLMYSWSAATRDFAGSGFPGPGTAQHVAVQRALRDDVMVSTGNGTELGQTVEWNGSIWVKKRNWVTIEGGTHVDVNAALASRAGVCVEIAEGTGPTITAPIQMTQDSSSIVGRGDFNGSTINVNSTGAIDAIEVTAQHCRIEKVRLVAQKVYTTGFGIRLLPGSYETKIERCSFHEMASAIWHDRAVLTTIRDIEIANTFGPYGIVGSGALGATAEALIIEGHCPMNNPYPYAIVGSAAAWATGQTIAVGNVRVANSCIFQARVGGTTLGSGTGPAGAPTTDPTTARVTDINDNDVRWRYVGPYNTWIGQDSYCNTVSVGPNVGCINGGKGFRMFDTANTGTSYPIIARLLGTQFDHNLTHGIELVAGQDARLINPWVSSVLAEDGIRARSTFGNGYHGAFQIVGGQVFGSAGNGVLVECHGWDIDSLNSGNNGTLTHDTFDGLRIAAGVSRFGVRGGMYGDLAAPAANKQRWGIVVFTGGSDDFVITGVRTKGNVRTGNVVHGIQNDGTGSNKYTTGNVGVA